VRPLNNLELIGAAVVVLVLISLAILTYPHERSVGIVGFYILIIAIGGIAAVVVGYLFKSLENKQSVWLQSPSRKVDVILINTIVMVWLGVVGVIVIAILSRKGPTSWGVLAGLLFIAGAAFGRYLGKRFSVKSLLPYAVSYFVVLVVVLLALAVV